MKLEELGRAVSNFRSVTEQDLQHVLEMRGYWVAWSVTEQKIGAVIRPWDALTSQKFVIIAETNKPDHDHQLWLLGEAPLPLPVGMIFHFYRVVTD